MTITCDTNKIAEAIEKDVEREAFIRKFPPDKFSWGIQLQTCDKWTTAQQGKIWRDFTIAAKLLETNSDTIYSIIQRAKPTLHLFQKEEWVGKEGRGKYVTTEKRLSKFTKGDCVEAIPLLHEYLELVISSVYQEVVIVNWSNKENKDLPDWEFTGKPFSLSK